MSLCLDILFQVVRIVEYRLGQTPSCQVMCQIRSTGVDHKSTQIHTMTSYFTVGLRCNWLVFSTVFHLCRHYVLWLQKSRSKSCEVGFAWTHALEYWRCYPIFSYTMQSFVVALKSRSFLHFFPCFVSDVHSNDLVELVFR